MNFTTNKLEKAILSEVLIFIIGIILVFFFFYLPQSIKANSTKQSLDSFRRDIAQIKSIIEGGSSIEESKKILKNKLEILETRFPPREGEIIKRISQVAKDLNIEILSLTPSVKTPLKDSPSVEGKNCYVLPIAIEATGEFVKVIDYLKELTNKLPYFITIEGINLTKSDKDGLLKIRLSLNAYLLLTDTNNG